MLTGEIQIRVRYAETDRMGLLHHANYLSISSKVGQNCSGNPAAHQDLEDRASSGHREDRSAIRLPARYDDLLTLRTIVTRTTPVRIEHRYEVLRGTQLLAEGSSTLACVDGEGNSGSAGLAISIGRCLAATRSRRSGGRQCNVLRSASLRVAANRKDIDHERIDIARLHSPSSRWRR